jgi:hypothetical protein
MVGANPAAEVESLGILFDCKLKQKELIMKLHALGASAVALTLAFTTPSSALESNLRSFTIATVSSVTIALKCEGYTVVEGGAVTLADRNGVSRQEVNAIIQAMLAQADQPYDADALIPEITVVVRDVLRETLRVPKSDLCGKVANSAAEAGFIRRK